MANIRSAEKRNRQSQKRRESNRAERSKLRGQVKKVRATIEAGDKGATQEELKAACSVIDRAAKRNIIKGNTAARYKSRLSRQAKKTSTGNA